MPGSMSTCARRVKCILLSYAMGIAGGHAVLCLGFTRFGGARECDSGVEARCFTSAAQLGIPIGHRYHCGRARGVVGCAGRGRAGCRTGRSCGAVDGRHKAEEHSGNESAWIGKRVHRSAGEFSNRRCAPRPECISGRYADCGNGEPATGGFRQSHRRADAGSHVPWQPLVRV
jgi:hypothetical protein